MEMMDDISCYKNVSNDYYLSPKEGGYLCVRNRTQESSNKALDVRTSQVTVILSPLGSEFLVFGGKKSCLGRSLDTEGKNRR